MDRKALENHLRSSPQEWNDWRKANPNAELNFVKSNFDGCSLLGRNLAGADLSGASFRNADLQWCVLRKAILNYADLSGANLQRANLTEAKLFEADISRADLRRAEGVRLDCTRIERTRFSPDSDDLWSVLRRAYTGSRLMINVLLLVVFALPLVMRGSLWIGVNQLQKSYIDIANRAAEVSEQSSVQGTPMAKTFSRVASKVPILGPCLRVDCSDHYVFTVLFGFDQGFLVWLPTVLLLLYNVLRAGLTFFVSSLREEEERSGVSPPYQERRLEEVPRPPGLRPAWEYLDTIQTMVKRARKGWLFQQFDYAPLGPTYGWLRWPHFVVQGLLWVALALLASHMHEWLFSDVWLPKTQ